jgi:isopenicillin-N N-acyltransferase like protein
MAGSLYPSVHVSGDALSRGRQYGEAARTRILASVELYRDAFLYDAALDWAAVRELASAFVEPIGSVYPNYLTEMKGIAEGANLDLLDVLAINVRSEVKIAAMAKQARSQSPSALMDGCTTVAAAPRATASGHTLLAQNWDWYEACEDTAVILEVEQSDGPNYVTVVEAGLLAKTGFNANGVGVVTNLLASDRDAGTPGIPYHICLRAILDAEHIVDALSKVQASFRSSSANYMIADPDGLPVVVEAWPGDYSALTLIEPDREGWLVHTNHFVSSQFPCKDVGRWAIPGSPFRLWRAREAVASLAEPATPASIGAVLTHHFSSRSVSTCLHPIPDAERLERGSTVVSVVMDLDERRMWVADGPPCEHPFREIDCSWLG